jgi:hypothetical protein
MAGGEFKGSLKSGIADADVSLGAGTEGVKASADVAVQPEVRDLVAAASGMALSALTGPWGPALLIAAGAGLYLYRRQKAKGAGG